MDQSLIAWLSDVGSWSAHPLFTGDASSAKAHKFQRFFGVPLLSREPLHPASDRKRYFSVCDGEQQVRGQTAPSKKPQNYLLSDDLRRLAEARPRYLTLTFDQGLSRGAERKLRRQVRAKLKHFHKKKLHGSAYVSHVSSLIFGPRPVANHAYTTLLRKSGLPVSRFETRCL